MQPDFNQILWILGRLLLGGLFVIGGVRHFFILPAIAQVMAARGVPAPRLVLIAGSAFQIAAGLLLILGMFVLLASAGLAIFTVIASAMLLNFWDMEGAARDAAKNNWLSNIAIIGGLLIAAAHSF